VAPVALSAAELGGLFHVPADPSPLLRAEASRVAPAPPEALSPRGADEGAVTVLGEAWAGGEVVPFGLSQAERRQHLYVVGKTGTGKSTLLANLVRQDLEAGRGFALLDPHGDLAERALALVPPGREGSIAYLDPADRDWPVGLNPLHAAAPRERPLVASGVVGAFKKLWGDSWGPRLEHFLRNAVLLLLEDDEPTLAALPRVLADAGYRRRLLARAADPLLRGFFLDEFEAADARWRAEAIAPILNKVGQFLASPLVRHVVGQKGPGLPLGEAMDEGLAVVANLSAGRIGEDGSALVGGLLVAGLQLAAMRRAERPEGERRDFALVVDEFQRFDNEAFAQILSEARKYRLSLVLSHQYLGQLSPGTADAVTGNAGSLAAFRMGAPDAARLARELAPEFGPGDLVNLPDFRFVAQVRRSGEAVPAFSARTLPPPSPSGSPAAVVEASRQRWARPRAEVETEIADLWEGRSG
jgi:DNA helicase HerA-like ATPase